jgi:hypothetical protein
MIVRQALIQTAHDDDVTIAAVFSLPVGVSAR